MPELGEGESVEIQGTTNWYTLARRGDVYSCTCPSWMNQRMPIEQRSCKHIRAYRGGYALTATASLPGAPEYEEATEVRAQRTEALSRALELYVVLYDKMEETFGLRMPEQLAYLAGFFLGLSTEERARLTDGPGLLGVATYFDEAHAPVAGHGGVSAPRSDERVRDRQRSDPPELVVVLSGMKGERYGFWYDDPNELPSATALRGTAERAQTELFEDSLLRTLFDKLVAARWTPRSESDADVPREPDKVELAILSWLAEVMRREQSAARGPMIVRPRSVCFSGVTPFVFRGWTVPEDLSGWLEQRKRMASYEARSAEVNASIEQALQEIKDGAPGRALFIGQELLWFDAPGYGAECSELLGRAYRALGRRALGDILRAQYKQFLPKVQVFELPPVHAVIAAAAAGDAAGVADALAEAEPPTAEELAEALASATSVEVASQLLDIDAAETDSALWRRLVDMKRGPQEEAMQRTRALVHLFVTRGVVNARAYGRLLELGDEELLDVATSRVTLASEDARGRSPLHLAAGAAAPKAVRALLDRGADACAEDSAGCTAYESARAAWRVHPREAGEIFGMLVAAGGGPKTTAPSVPAPEVEAAREALALKPPPPPSEDFEWTDGIAVHHARLGDGIVEEVLEGEGDDTKLKIRFEKETRSLLAKFVKRT